MSRFVGIKPKKEPAAIPAPVEKPEPAEQPKKVTKRPKKAAPKVK